MKNSKIKLPAMDVEARYGAGKNNFFCGETSNTVTTATSQGDPTNTCTTIFTTTHFV